MRNQFINSWITQQQRAFHQSTRGVMNPKARRALEEEAEQAMAEIERKAAEKAWLVGYMNACSDFVGAGHHENPYGLTAGQEGKNDE